MFISGARSHAQESPAIEPQAIATPITLDIITNTTWTLAASPYEVAININVSPGVGLTIEPGVQVRFAQNAGLRVLGTLTAVGTAEKPILFTGTTAQKGWWDNISVEGTLAAPNTGSVFDYVTIEYGGGVSYYANLYLSYATVTVSHSTIRNSARDGLYAYSGGVAHLSHTTVANNGTAADHYAIRFHDASMNPLLSNVTATGNANDAIALGGGTMAGVHLWENVGLPYVILNDVVVAAGASLTIEPGVQVRFAQYVGLSVLGTLTAVGTAEKPILFTGTTPQKGWWENISIQGTNVAPNTGSVLDYVTIEYGGGYYANLYLSYATVSVSHSSISESARDGLYTYGGGVMRLSHTTVANNGTAADHYAIRFHDASMNPLLSNVTATGNVNNAIALGGGTMAGDHLWENVGLPYIILNDVVVAAGASLAIEAGVEVRFMQSAGLRVQGRLTAIGREGARILFTGTTAQKGWWENINIQGSNAHLNQGSALDYVTIEYGGGVGAYANLYLSYATVTVSHSIIRNSALDGIRFDAGAGASMIESSQIVDNQAYGVFNYLQNAPLLAANNWWGAATGPIVKDHEECNAGGTGSRVSLNVEYRPVLNAANAPVSPVAPSRSNSLSVTPLRWFIPADGVTRGEVTITLRDGEGNPVAGHQVSLRTTLGSVITGSLTDAQGQARARIASDLPGEAQLTASVQETNPCIIRARSGLAVVTFTAFNPGELMPNAAAPYMNSGLEFYPEPIVKGVSTVIVARVVNPNDFPISVNGDFGIAQSGIGLAFPPVGSVENRVIPANSVGVISVNWTPPISGHYCMRFEYNWQGVGTAEAAAVQGRQTAQRNLNVYGATPGGYSDKEILNKASTAGTYVGGLGNGTGEGFIPGVGATILTEWQLTMTARISRALGFDPPRQDYTIIAVAEPVTLPPVPAGNGVSPQMAAALNDLRTQLAWVNAHGSAAIISYDRYGGAAAAGDLQWASAQINALNMQKQEMAKRILEAADALDAYRAARQTAGIADAMLTADNLRAYQARLVATGFTQEEIAAAHAVGMTDAEIEEVRLQHIAADPDEQAGSFSGFLTNLAALYRQVGAAILYPPTFGLTISGSPGSASLPAAVTAVAPPPEMPPTNNLARVYEVVNTIQIGNPTGQTATIDLRVRPVDLPSDWMVAVSPVSVTLAAGAQVAVEVRITPGGPAVQGTIPRVAVEGYVGSALLGGVTMDVIVPRNVLKPEKPIFLPVIATS